MKKVNIPGTATISPRGFHFTSDACFPILSQPLDLNGRLHIRRDGSARMVTTPPAVPLAPRVVRVSQGADYLLNRTSRHYILQIKLPIVESRFATQERLYDILPQAMGDITLDRREL